MIFFFLNQHLEHHGNFKRFSRHKETNTTAKVVSMVCSEKHPHFTYSEMLEVCRTYLVALVKLVDFLFCTL